MPPQESPSVVVPPTRREFCAHACQAASVAAVGLIGAACGGSSPTSPSGGSGSPLATVDGSVSGRNVSVTITAGSPLAGTGTAALVNTSLGSFLISRAGDAFTVLTGVCTHQGCTVSNFAGGRFSCPCHGSQFTTSGSVANGPATRPLQSFPAQFSNGVVTFSA